MESDDKLILSVVNLKEHLHYIGLIEEKIKIRLKGGKAWYISDAKQLN